MVAGAAGVTVAAALAATTGMAVAVPLPLSDPYPMNAGEVCSGPKPCSFDAPVVVGSPSGKVLGTWVKHNNSDLGTLFARIYRPLGTPLQPEAQLSDTQAVMDFPTAAVFDPAGQYLIAWSDQTQINGDVFVRRVNLKGTPVAPAIDLAPSAFKGGDDGTSYAQGISLAMAPDRSFTAVWRVVIPPFSFSDVNPFSVGATRFDANDHQLATPVLLNQHPASYGGTAVCTTTDGGAVAVWVSTTLPDAVTPVGVSARRINAAGAVQGTEVVVQPPTGAATAATIGCGTQNAFLVVWQSDQIAGAAHAGILAQRFTQLNNPLPGGAQRIDDPAADTGDQVAPALSQAPDGSFIVVWEDQTADGGRLVGRHISPFGVPLSDEFQIATGLAPGEQPTVTHYGTEGDFLVAWALNHHIYARRYTADSSHPTPD